MYVDLTNSKPILVYNAVTDPLITNMYLSLTIVRRSWWFNPEFGIKKDLIKKNVSNSKDIVKDVILDAFQWMIDAGKAKGFSVVSELDLVDINRINLDIQAFKVNGDIVNFSTFLSVI